MKITTNYLSESLSQGHRPSSGLVRSFSSESFVMRVFLIGVSCVGKTSIGAKLAPLLGYLFFDLYHEIETFFGKPLERLQAECLSKNAFRKKACQALRHLLAQDQTENCVVALPPSGLMGEYPRLWK